MFEALRIYYSEACQDPSGVQVLPLNASTRRPRPILELYRASRDQVRSAPGKFFGTVRKRPSGARHPFSSTNRDTLPCLKLKTLSRFFEQIQSLSRRFLESLTGNKTLPLEKENLL